MIRRAQEKDVPKIGDLLRQVCLVHHHGRPDIFKAGRKYTDEQLQVLLQDAARPILVAVDDSDEVMGYCFCIFQQPVDNGALTDIKTLYIDDLCVDESLRGRHIGKELYEAAVQLARDSGCAFMRRRVWHRKKWGWNWCCKAPKAITTKKDTREGVFFVFSVKDGAVSIYCFDNSIRFTWLASVFYRIFLIKKRKYIEKSIVI